MKPDLIRRQRALEATLAKFRGRVFDWRAGHTCAHLAKFHMRRMGHKGVKVPQFQSALGARRALHAMGANDMREALGMLLPEIPPAMMLPGDLCTTDSADGFGAVLVCVGPHKLLGWHEDADGMVVIDFDMAAVTGAFRV